MAELRVSTALLKELLLPGVNANIVRGIKFDERKDEIVLEVSGPDVPDCQQVSGVVSKDWGTMLSVPTTTTKLQPV